MESKNHHNVGLAEPGPKSPKKEEDIAPVEKQNDDLNTSGDSQVQQGEQIVNEQDQDNIVNPQEGEGIEEFVNEAANSSVKS